MKSLPILMIVFFALIIYSCQTSKKSTKVITAKKTEKEKKDTLSETKKDDKVKIIFHEKKPTYKIAFLLPFNTADAVRTNYIDEENSETIIDDATKNILQFYEGALLAVDSLKKSEVNLELFVYDCPNDTNQLNKLLDIQPALANMKMIISGNSNPNLHKLSEFAKQHRIYLLSANSPSPSVTLQNPYYLILNPTLKTHCRNIHDFISENYKYAKIFMVQQKEEKNSFTAEYFRNAFKESELKEIFYDIESRFDSTLFSLTNTNIIIVPSMDEVFVNNALGKLKNLFPSYKTVVFGMPTWDEMESLRIEYLQNLNVHITASYWTNPADTLSTIFEKKYFHKFKTIPSIHSYLGYDITLWMGNIFNNYTLNIPSQVSKTYHGISTSLKFQESFGKPASTAGSFDFFENEKLHILKFENYSLKIVNRDN